MRRATLLVLFAASTFAVAAACESVPALTFRAPDAELDEAGPDAGDGGRLDGQIDDGPSIACDPDALPPNLAMCCPNGSGCGGNACSAAACSECQAAGCGPGDLCCTKSTGGAPARCSGRILGQTCP
jgi:hypothetical protein